MNGESHSKRYQVFPPLSGGANIIQCILMAAGRRKLTALVHAAATARQGSVSLLNSSSYHSRLQQHSFFSSWLERHIADHHSKSGPCPFTFTLGAVHLSLVNKPQEPAQSLELSPVPSSYVSLSPSSSSRSASIDFQSLLCIRDVKTDKQSCNFERSTEEDASDHACTPKNDRSPKHHGSWCSEEVVNWPNAISFGRLLSGPLLAWLIIEGLLQPAVVGLVVAGASDWFDGYVARRKGIDSVCGTYLDPLADKVLIGCVAISMAQAGYLPVSLVALVIARDVALIGGSILLRAHNLKWQVTDLLNVTKGSIQKVEPLYISKINTVFQLALVSLALLQPAFGVEDSYSLIPFLSQCVVFTTCTSFVGYGWKLFRQRR